MRLKKFTGKLILYIDFLVIMIFGCVVLCNLAVDFNGRNKTFSELDKIPHNKMGVLLAVGPSFKNGDHDFELDGRIDGTVDLYKSHKIDKIIVSGGIFPNQWAVVDQPAIIRDSLILRGIPENDIIIDEDGVRTLNSVRKIRDVYSLDSVTFISQKDHNQRAIWMAEHLGISAVGYNAVPTPVMRRRVESYIHEYLARVKMFVDFIADQK